MILKNEWEGESEFADEGELFCCRWVWLGSAPTMH